MARVKGLEYVKNGVGIRITGLRKAKSFFQSMRNEASALFLKEIQATLEKEVRLLKKDITNINSTFREGGIKTYKKAKGKKESWKDFKKRMNNLDPKRNKVLIATGNYIKAIQVKRSGKSVVQIGIFPGKGGSKGIHPKGQTESPKNTVPLETQSLLELDNYIRNSDLNFWDNFFDHIFRTVIPDLDNKYRAIIKSIAAQEGVKV